MRLPRVPPSFRSQTRDGSGQPEPDPIAAALELLATLSPAQIQAYGYHLQRREFYSPLNDIPFLLENRDLWQGRPLPPAIDWDLESQERLLTKLEPYGAELHDVPLEPPAEGPSGFYWNNDFWRSTDALLHYGLLRHSEPARVVEIGCGWSSLLMARALARNEKPCAVHQIEPNPRKDLMAALPADWTSETAILQRASLEPVERLGAGDILFYDGSHVSRAASDVNWFFFELLPMLAPGVLVHVHDVFLPDDYPEQWIVERGQTWNEQYLLQAFLMYNTRFKPLLASAALLKTFTDRVVAAVHDAGDTFIGCGSIWLVCQDPGS